MNRANVNVRRTHEMERRQRRLAKLERRRLRREEKRVELRGR